MQNEYDEDDHLLKIKEWERLSKKHSFSPQNLEIYKRSLYKLNGHETKKLSGSSSEKQ